nr:histone-lysine N-methyltransferase family member SUVH9-like [Tanacetum cinerariifolium]
MVKSSSCSENKRSDKNKEGLGYSVVPPSCSSLLSSQERYVLDRIAEFADDTITDYSRPPPSIESNSSDLQNSNSSISKHEESSESIMSKPMIKFVKIADSPTVIKTNKVETVRKSPIRYAEIYRKSPARNTSKSPKVKGNQRNWNNLKSQQLGKDFLMKNKACFKCGHFDHLARYDDQAALVTGTSVGLEAYKVVQQSIDVESTYDNDAQDQVSKLEMKVLVDGKQDEAKAVKLVVVAVEQNIDKPYVEGLSFPPCLIYTITSLASSSSLYPPESSNGESIATSVIVSDSYEDDEDEGYVIVYTGHSGQDKHLIQLVHQKLEGGIWR